MSRDRNTPLKTATAFAVVVALGGSAGAGETRPFVDGSWQQIVSAHKAEPTIVHFWGLTCGPCLAELPDWGKFRAGHPGVRLVLINWDATRLQDAARAEAALKKDGLYGVESWALAAPFEEKARFQIDRDWQGELPHTQLIARDGGATAFSGAAEFSKIETWLKAQP
jgi:thiol-disulfide isomerase/thioredoxin